MIRPKEAGIRLTKAYFARCDLGHKWAALAYFLMAVLAGSALAQEKEKPDDKPIIGEASVVDAGELDIGGRKLLLYAIQAPGIRQRCRAGSMPWFCGANAAKSLREMVEDKNVRCEIRDRDAKKQIFVVCFVGNIEINREWVRLGHAQADRRVPDYGPEETAARRAKRGIWQGVLIPE